MTTSEGISERAHHSLVAYGDHLYSFAGCNIFHFCFNDLFVYNLGAYLLSLAYVVSRSSSGLDGDGDVDVGRGRRAVDGHGGAPNTLVDDFKHLLDDPSLSDITFVFPNEGDKKIRAHKNIISARCAPMQALLRSGTRALLLSSSFSSSSSSSRHGRFM